MGLLGLLKSKMQRTGEIQFSKKHQNAVMIISPKYSLSPRNEAEMLDRKRQDFKELLNPENTQSAIFESMEELFEFRPDLANVMLNGTGYPSTKYPYYRFNAHDCGDHALVEVNDMGYTAYYHEIPLMKFEDVHVFVRVTANSIKKTISEADPWIMFYGFMNS